MLQDNTIYRLYLVRQSETATAEEIRAVSKVCGLNYPQAFQTLKTKSQVLLAQGDAYNIRDAINTVCVFDICCKVMPDYPYLSELTNPNFLQSHNF